MKRKPMIIILCVVLTLAIILPVAAKYLWEEYHSLEFTGGVFYFRSNVLTDDATPPTETVLGSSTTFVIANAADSTHISDSDIAYSVTYAVKKDGAWTAVETRDALSFQKNTYGTESFTVSPITYEGTTYYDILVTAKATAPFTKTLQCEFQFQYKPYTVTHSYDKDVGVITMTVATNNDSGSFRLYWADGVLPDNADPNGILTYAGAGKASLVTTLEAHTVYVFTFFVDSSVRDFVDSQLESLGSVGSAAYEAGLKALLIDNITCTKED